MNKEPTLVIMAAGTGSRFGGLKQIEPVDEQGHIIIDFSLYDAFRAGFRKVVFVIKKEIESDFIQCIGKRMEKWFEVSYEYQDLAMLPDGYTIPTGRSKPWGTGHAVASAREAVKGPFAVINADDFYGPTAFKSIYDFLASNKDENLYAMVGYRLCNTVTENGSVARGICEVKDGILLNITEHTKIFKDGSDAKFTEDNETFTHISGSTIVSMNLWGFTARMMDELWNRFPAFLDKNLPVNPLKCEYFLPYVVNEQIEEKCASVRVLPCEEAWYGVTYKEDLASIKNAIQAMKNQGIYTEELWK